MAATDWLVPLSGEPRGDSRPASSEVVGWSQDKLVALVRLLSNPVGPLKTLLDQSYWDATDAVEQVLAGMARRCRPRRCMKQ